MPTITNTNFKSIFSTLINVCIFKLLKFEKYFHFSSSEVFTWLQKKKESLLKPYDISASLKYPELHLQLSLGLCEALLVLHITHNLLLMLFQGMLNATQNLHLVALMFNLSISKFEPTIHLLVHVDEFHPLLFLNEVFFLKNLILINSSY